MGVVLVTGSPGLTGRGVIRPSAQAGYTATRADNKRNSRGSRRMPGETPV